MKLTVLFTPKFMGILTKVFTGCYAYHVAWVDEENDRVYDMRLQRRRRVWTEEYSGRAWVMFDFPEVTREYLEGKMDVDDSVYSWKDYLMFAIKPIADRLGIKLKDAGGEICSSMVNKDLWAFNLKTPFSPIMFPPSPCDLLNWCTKTKPIYKSSQEFNERFLKVK